MAGKKKSRCVSFKDHRGFTLVELLMVIGILGMLAAIAVQQIKFNRENAYDRQAQATMRHLLTYAAVDTPQGADGSGSGGNLEPYGYPEVELPDKVLWKVVNDDEDRYRFFFAHPGGKTGFYFWVPGDTYALSLNSDEETPPNRSDKIYSNLSYRAEFGL